MSADNGIYILRTKDKQIRVIHTKAIENIFDVYGEYIPKQIEKYFGNIPYTKDMNVANNIAQKMFKDIDYCEYGIRILPECNKTWKEILKEAGKNIND